MKAERALVIVANDVGMIDIVGRLLGALNQEFELVAEVPVPSKSGEGEQGGTVCEVTVTVEEVGFQYSQRVVKDEDILARLEKICSSMLNES